jgi:hypothetical protein
LTRNSGYFDITNRLYCSFLFFVREFEQRGIHDFGHFIGALPQFGLLCFFVHINMVPRFATQV